jgi:large subunit ribosomal protein L1
VELCINLNVDPRRPGQALRGSLRLPHGTGKQISCLVFSKDPSLVEKAKQAGHMAGGDELMDQLVDGTFLGLDQYQRALATKDIMPQLSKRLARVLGPRGLMPNPKTNTIFESDESGGETLLATLQAQSSTVTYRSESNGILHFSVGKGSFDPHQLLDNVQAVCHTVQEVKPETYGKGKKKGGSSSKKMGKNVKYWLRAHLSSTQGKGVRMDLRTVDPTSPFFMKDPE